MNRCSTFNIGCLPPHSGRPYHLEDKALSGLGGEFHFAIFGEFTIATDTNNVFYGLGKQYANYSYPLPKANFGLRNYRLFTYPMRILYYAVGLYLLEVTQEFVTEYYRKCKSIDSFYGGKLLFDGVPSKLLLNKDNIWYKKQYQEFRTKAKDITKGRVEHRVVTRLDIQNYFDDISVPRLLSLITDFVKPSVQKTHRFDATSQRQIVDFFSYLSHGQGGIPQTDNDIISSYIGYLYLVFADLMIEQLVAHETIKGYNHSILRYMDDIYVVIEFDAGVTSSDRQSYISHLISRIADCLYEKFNLRLNTKTRSFWLNNPDDLQEFVQSLKKVSSGYEIATGNGKPQQKLNEIFKQLRTLKRSSLDLTFRERTTVDEDILKEVYDISVAQLLYEKANKKKIETIFADFNFDLVIVQPQEIVIILLTDQDARSKFEQFLLQKQQLSSRDVWLILNFLCQTEFKSTSLIEHLRKSSSMQAIVTVFLDSHIPLLKPGYFELDSNQVLKLADKSNIVEQIRLRVQSEATENYSVALNHLLNEVHTVCEILDRNNINKREYDANDVIS